MTDVTGVGGNPDVPGSFGEAGLRLFDQANGRVIDLTVEGGRFRGGTRHRSIQLDGGEATATISRAALVVAPGLDATGLTVDKVETTLRESTIGGGDRGIDLVGGGDAPTLRVERSSLTATTSALGAANGSVEIVDSLLRTENAPDYSSAVRFEQGIGGETLTITGSTIVDSGPGNQVALQAIAYDGPATDFGSVRNSIFRADSTNGGPALDIDLTLRAGGGPFTAVRSSYTTLQMSGTGYFAYELAAPPAPAGGGDPPPAGAAPAAARDGLAPVIGSLSATNRVFAAASLARRERTPRGTRFRYSLSEAARVQFVIERRAAGRRVRGKCRKPGKRGKRCTRLVRVGSFSVAGSAGRNDTAFSGRIGRRKLRVGRYRARLVAVDFAGNRSRERTVSFHIVRR